MLEGEDDQVIAGEHRDALAESAVHRGLTAPRVGRVEARQIVVNQRGAVHHLDRGRRRVRDVRVRISTRRRDG